MEEFTELEDMTKDQIIDLIEQSRKEIDSVAVEIHKITEQIADNHRNRFLITNQCMKLQGICKNLGEYYID